MASFVIEPAADNSSIQWIGPVVHCWLAGLDPLSTAGWLDWTRCPLLVGWVGHAVHCWSLGLDPLSSVHCCSAGLAHRLFGLPVECSAVPNGSCPGWQFPAASLHTNVRRHGARTADFASSQRRHFAAGCIVRLQNWVKISGAAV